MKFLIAASILAVLQVSPSVPQKAPAPAPIKNADHPPAQDKGREQVTSSDKQEHVVVERFPDKDTWDKTYILLTGALVFIGALTLGTIVYQAIQTKRATVAMERSTGITIEVERGRIGIVWGQVIHADLSPTGIHDGRLEACFNWGCTNAGRTPAVLISTWSKLIIIDKLSELPGKPFYDINKEKIYAGDFLEPNGKGLQTPYFAAKLETDLIWDEVQKRTRSGQCFLYAYGYARYRDVWDNPHITRFGLVRVISDSILRDYWKAAGPSEYNNSD